MIKFLQSINKKYDKMEEPYRFFAFTGLFMPAFILTGIGASYEYIPMFAGTWIYLLLMFAIRVAYIYGAFKSE